MGASPLSIRRTTSPTRIAVPSPASRIPPARPRTVLMKPALPSPWTTFIRCACEMSKRPAISAIVLKRPSLAARNMSTRKA